MAAINLPGRVWGISSARSRLWSEFGCVFHMWSRMNPIVASFIPEITKAIGRGAWGVALEMLSKERVIRRIYERIKPIRIPGSIRSVLFVCKANICRSPLAEAYLKRITQSVGVHIAISSAGLEAGLNMPADRTAMFVARSHGLSLDCHVTTMLSEDLVKSSDVIIVMQIAQRDRIVRLYSHAKGKVVLLGGFDKGGPLEIEDPYGRTVDQFMDCFVQIRRSCDAFLRTVLKRSPVR